MTVAFAMCSYGLSLVCVHGEEKTWHLFVIFFYQGIVAFQCCVSFCCMAKWISYTYIASQVALVVKNPLANAGDTRDVGSITGLGRSPGVGIGKLLQYLHLENSMNREEFLVLYNQFSSVIYFVHSSVHMWIFQSSNPSHLPLPHFLFGVCKFVLYICVSISALQKDCLYHFFLDSTFMPCCCSVTQLCLTLCDSMDSSTLGFSVLHQFPELAQIHVFCFLCFAKAFKFN